MLGTIRRVFESYGFEPLDTPAFEYADALGKFLPDADRPNEGVFALQDDDEQWMALRYDLTAPLARFAAQNWESLPKPFRRYPSGRCGATRSPGRAASANSPSATPTPSAPARPTPTPRSSPWPSRAGGAGLPRGAYVMKINNRKLLNGLLSHGPAGDAGQAPGRAARHRQARPAGPRRRARAARRRAARTRFGDFTKGAGLNAAQPIACWLRRCRAPAHRDARRPGRVDRRLGRGRRGPGGAGAIDAALTAGRRRRPQARSIPPSCAGWNITPARCSRPS